MYPQIKYAEQNLAIGVVTATHDGVATYVCDEQQIAYKVELVSSSMPFLKKHDRVLFYVNAGQAIVICKLQKVHEHKPSHSFTQVGNNKMEITFGKARISVETTGQISFSVGKASFVLDNQGNILCQAPKISMSALTNLTLATKNNDIHFVTQ